MTANSASNPLCVDLTAKLRTVELNMFVADFHLRQLGQGVLHIGNGRRYEAFSSSLSYGEPFDDEETVDQKFRNIALAMHDLENSLELAHAGAVQVLALLAVDRSDRAITLINAFNYAYDLCVCYVERFRNALVNSGTLLEPAPHFQSGIAKLQLPPRVI